MSYIYDLAKSLCENLFEKGYTAYFAGGWVRDLLLKKPTDEIDIATNAPPNIVQELFPKTIAVGAKYGVIIVVLDGVNFEVSTFRKDHPYLDGRHPEGVDFSTSEKDALRRDFTINGMFYDPLTDKIYDYVEGQQDLKKHIIRAIGDPKERFAEDRLRMIRAVRFSSRLGFRIEEKTSKAISEYATTLFPSVSMERIWQEFNKMACSSRFDLALISMHRLGLLPVIFPQLRETPLSEIEQRVSPFAYFPYSCPTIVYLLELFPDFTLEKRLDLCDYLKTTNEDRKLVEFFTHAETVFTKNELELCEWASFYANPHSQLFLKVKAAKLLPPDRTSFLDAHSNRQKQLKKHIERLQKKQPLVTSDHLRAAGIKPGKQMGLLLKEAEKIAINENHDHAEAVLKRLNLP